MNEKFTIPANDAQAYSLMRTYDLTDDDLPSYLSTMLGELKNSRRLRKAFGRRKQHNRGAFRTRSREIVARAKPRANSRSIEKRPRNRA